MSGGARLADEPKEYWFNTNTNQVELGKQVAAIYRIGPFSDYETAKRALQILQERAQAWRAEEENRD
ncbi:MAG: hypothetical protein KA421_05625 [Rhodoluna sp.]|nr:hypothetical protein [Rhodoluna sp.]